MKTLYLSLALFIILTTSSYWLFTQQSPVFEQSTESTNQISKDGLTIALAIKPATTEKNALLEAQPASVQFTIQQAADKQPAKGLHPSVWLEREEPQQKPTSCKDRINSYLQSQMGYKPEISLNSYFILTMNNNPTISVIDPINGFGGSKLMARIKLNSPAVDWALSKDQKRLYIATPLTRQVAVVDTQTWKAINFLTLDATPKRLALQPDGKYLWVGLDTADKSSASISVIDTETLVVTKSLATGQGSHEFAFSNDSRTAYVSNRDDITVIDIAQLSQQQTINSPAPVVALAFSALSQSVYAATENGTVQVINATANTQISTGASLKTMRFTSDGRWGFALSQTANKLFIIDASLNRLVHTVDVGVAPDQISFTDHYAYIRSTGSELVSMIQLDALAKESAPAVTTFSGGQSAPNQPNLPLSDAIMPTPERSAVVVANPTDKIIYYYMEGMAAPMGNFENQGLQPMAVMIVNRSMQEISEGVYTATTQLPPAGQYKVSILLDNPPTYHCFSTKIAANPELVKQSGQPVKIEYLLDKKEVPVGHPVAVKLKLSHPDQERVKDSVKDLQVLVFRIPGQSQQRLSAKPQGDGVYQIEFTPTEEGVYQLFAQSATLNFTFNEQPSLTLRAIKSNIQVSQ